MSRLTCYNQPAGKADYLNKSHDNEGLAAEYDNADLTVERLN
jgi:hypothetical protein